MTATAEANYIARRKARYYQDNKWRWWESAWRERGIYNDDGRPFLVVDYEAMLARQGNRCAVCGETQTKAYTVVATETGRARALVCGRCSAPMAWAMANRQAVLAHLA